jgi:hypothetical protein
VTTGIIGFRVPIVENPDATLWIDIDDISEVDAVQKRLSELGVPVAARAPDPGCDVALNEVEWSELYPRIVPRNGPEPGIIVAPAEIPEGHTLLLVNQLMPGPRPGHEPKVVRMLSLIRGPAPPRFGSPHMRLPRPPSDIADQRPGRSSSSLIKMDIAARRY